MQKISTRLLSCCELVRNGKRLCDVGCDHGYVPAYLVQNNIIPSAVACDINEGPLNSCRQLVSELNYEDKIKCVLSNGLEKINKDEVDDILIAGMGGELIANILASYDWVNEKHLILNPMTHPEITRKWLFDNGFEIENDIVVADGKHHYSIFDAYYTANTENKTPADYYLGNIKDFSDKEYFNHLLNYLKNKQKSGENLNEIINAIEEKI